MRVCGRRPLKPSSSMGKGWVWVKCGRKAQNIPSMRFSTCRQNFAMSFGSSKKFDGLIAIRADTDGWTWVFWPQRGEYANVTRFLTEDDALSALEISPLGPEVFECAVMTDGLESLALHYATRAAHSPFFEGMLLPLRAASGTGENSQLSERLQNFLYSPRIRDRVDDDLTLAIACRVGTDASSAAS